MKKTHAILSAVALVGSITAAPSAHAVANTAITAGTTYYACDGGGATSFAQYNGPGTPNTNTANFVKTGFLVTCSANSNVAFIDASPTQFQVGAGSTKGNQSFRGSSNGGAVVTHTRCAGTNSACTSADASTAATAASSM